MDNHNLTMCMTVVKLNRLGYTIIKLNSSKFQSKIYRRFYFKIFFGSILFLPALHTHYDYDYEYPYDYQYQYQVWIAAWVSISISMRVIEL